MSVADIWARYGGTATVDRTDEEALEALHRDGGFSRHILTGEAPHSGYMVSLHNTMGGEESIHNLGDITTQHLADHRARAQAVPHRFQVYQGGWVHDGKAYLDRSVNVPDAEQAKEMGRKHKQLAVWDVTGNKEIPIK